MAKKSRNRTASRRVTRYASVPLPYVRQVSYRRAVSRPLGRLTSKARRAGLSTYADARYSSGRLYTPSPTRIVNRKPNAPVRVDRSPSTLRLFTPTFSTGLPRQALICARRSIRKEVIFAKNHAGKSGQKSPRFNPTSKVKC